MIEKPYEGRARINFDGVKFSVRIPSKKHWLIILFFAVWLFGWFMGETSTLKKLISGNSVLANSFMLAWIIVWSIGGLIVITFLLWMLFGQEIITIERGVFEVSRGILDLQIRKKNYDLNSIKHLELNHGPDLFNNFFGPKYRFKDVLSITGGKIRFDYGMKTIRFGLGIDEAEARHIIEEIKRYGFYKEN